MDPIIIHDRGRGPELVGTSTTVHDVIPYWLRGRSAEFIARRWATNLVRSRR
jgi:hypothetical protein